MKKTLVLLSVLLCLLLGACVTISPVPVSTDAHASPYTILTPSISLNPHPSVSALISLPPAPSLHIPFSAAPSATSEEAALLGEVSGSQYINKAVGLSAAIPEGWEAATQQQISVLYGYSSDYLEEKTGLGEGTNMPVFYCTEHGADYTGQNPNISIGISKETEMMALLEGEDALDAFLDYYRPLISELYGGAEVDVTGEAGFAIGGGEYSVLHIEGEFDGSQVYQDQYFRAADDYVLIITGTYYDKQYRAVVESFMDSIQYM